MFSLLGATLFFALPAVPQDEIILVSGKVLTVQRVLSETYGEVRYKTTGGAEGSKASHLVAKVEHNLGPVVLDDFAQALDLMEAGDFRISIQVFNDVLDDSKVMKETGRYAWVKQHTLFRQASCMAALADYEGVAITVDRLLAEIPDTFFFAPALMMKADALALAGNTAEALGVLATLSKAVDTEGLPERWERESELGSLLLDVNTVGKEKERKLQQLVEKNLESFPTVSSRARVEIGNAMVADNRHGDAERFFRLIVQDGQATEHTLAAAYSGLGDCAYHRGLQKEEAEASRADFEEAVLSHLRVVTLYKGAVNLVPRSMFYAGMALHRMNTANSRKQAKRLASRLNRDYSRSNWAARIKKELNLR